MSTLNEVLKNALNVASESHESVVVFEKELKDVSLVVRKGRLIVEMYEDGYLPITVCSGRTELDKDRALLIMKIFNLDSAGLNTIIETAKNHLISVFNEIGLKATSKTSELNL